MWCQGAENKRDPPPPGLFNVALQSHTSCYHAGWLNNCGSEVVNLSPVHF